jgi:hypothetical protein
MATTYSNLNIAAIEASIQAALKNALIPVSAFSSEFATDGMIVDDVMRVPVVGAPTAQVKTPGTAITDDGSLTGVNVTLDTPKQVAFKLIEGKVRPERMQETANAFAAEATYAMAKAILDAAFALVTATNYATKHTCAAADFGQNDLGLLFKLAEDKKLGRQRSLILNGQYAGSLLGESSLGLILATMGDSALKTAALPPLMGMTSYCYSGLPTNSENLGGVVIDKRAIAIGVAPLSDLVNPGEGDTMESLIVTETEIGISVHFRMVANGDGGYKKGLITAVFGVAKIQDAAVRLVSA